MVHITHNKHRLLELTIHIICWGLFFGFPLFFTQDNSGSIDWREFINHSGVSLSFFVIFYINYLLFIPKVLFKEHTGQFILLNILLILVVSIGLRYWHNIIAFPPPAPRRPHLPPQYIFYIRDITSMIFTVGLSVAIRMSLRWSATELERREAVKSRTEAELKNLRNQLNPHFLLNTLNNIYALTAFDTEKAQQAIQELSKLLRYVLYDNQETFVPLTKEVEFIQNYIELMRIRVSSAVKINTNFQIRPDSQSPVAPLLFISLIENAFKHGISPTEPSFIDIMLTEKDDEIHCVIRNSNYPKNAMDKSGSGIGLEQVRKRLELLYAGRYEWHQQISSNQKEYSSILTIKIPDNNKKNAFKHGISPTEPSFIDIMLTEKDDEIHCVIRNSNYPKNAMDKSGSGIGLEQVRKRLELLYAGRYEWHQQISSNQKEYSSILTIKIPDNNKKILP